MSDDIHCQHEQTEPQQRPDYSLHVEPLCDGVLHMTVVGSVETVEALVRAWVEKQLP